MKKTITLILITFIFSSCSKDDNPETNPTTPMEIYTSDFSTSMDENPENNQDIGLIEGTTNQGNVTFSLTNQSPNGALTIDSETGLLSVDNETLFDYETNPIINGTVKVANGELFKNSNIEIQLNDIDNCIESNKNMHFSLMDLLNDSNYTLTSIDLTTYEYTFTINEDLLLCSVGYQGFNNVPFLITLLDEDDNILYEEEMIFDENTQDFINITPIQLDTNKTYTIRRFIEWGNVGEYVSGKIIKEGNFEDQYNFPSIQNNITIISSNFYGTGGPSLDFGIPLITLGFK